MQGTVPLFTPGYGTRTMDEREVPLIKRMYLPVTHIDKVAQRNKSTIYRALKTRAGDLNVKRGRPIKGMSQGKGLLQGQRNYAN